MVKLKQKKLDLIFHALADSTRRDILDRIGTGQLGVAELAANYDMTLAAVSKHIKVLEKASLVRTKKEGRTHLCRVNDETIETASLVLRHYQKFWEDQLDALGSYFEESQKGDK